MKTKKNHFLSFRCKFQSSALNGVLLKKNIIGHEKDVFG
jgi:hypothetical protein